MTTSTQPTTSDAPAEERVPHVHKGTVVVLYSHASREDVRALTIADFARVGCPVAHVELQTEPPKAARNRRNAWGALKAGVRIAESVNARGLLVIEDDVIPADTLSAWLSYLERNEVRVVTLYSPSINAVHAHPVEFARWAAGKGRAPKPQVVSVRNVRAWWGAQALWFPLNLARLVASDWRFGIHERGWGAWDTALRQLLLEVDATLGLAVPNVVQHRGVTNVTNPRKQPHSSASFVSAAPAPLERED